MGTFPFGALALRQTSISLHVVGLGSKEGFDFVLKAESWGDTIRFVTLHKGNVAIRFGEAQVKGAGTLVSFDQRHDGIQRISGQAVY